MYSKIKPTISQVYSKDKQTLKESTSVNKVSTAKGTTFRNIYSLANKLKKYTQIMVHGNNILIECTRKYRKDTFPSSPQKGGLSK